MHLTDNTLSLISWLAGAFALVLLIGAAGIGFQLLRGRRESPRRRSDARLHHQGDIGGDTTEKTTTAGAAVFTTRRHRTMRGKDRHDNAQGLLCCATGTSTSQTNGGRCRSFAIGPCALRGAERQVAEQVHP